MRPERSEQNQPLLALHPIFQCWKNLKASTGYMIQEIPKKESLLPEKEQIIPEVESYLHSL